MCVCFSLESESALHTELFGKFERAALLFTYFPVHRATPRNTQHSLPRILDQDGHTTPGASIRRADDSSLTRAAREMKIPSLRRAFRTHFSGGCSQLLPHFLRFSLPQIFLPGTAKIFPLNTLVLRFFLQLQLHFMILPFKLPRSLVSGGFFPGQVPW